MCVAYPTAAAPPTGRTAAFYALISSRIDGCEYSYVNTYEFTTGVEPLFRGVWTQPPHNPKGCPKASNLEPIKIDTLLPNDALSSDQFTFTLRKGAFKTPLDL